MGIDVEELVSILSRGTGAQAFSPVMARKLAAEVIGHFGGEDGNSMPMEGFIQWWKEELKWSKMSAEEQGLVQGESGARPPQRAGLRPVTALKKAPVVNTFTCRA